MKTFVIKLSYQWTPGRIIPVTVDVAALDETEATTLAIQLVAIEYGVNETEISVLDYQEK